MSLANILMGLGVPAHQAREMVGTVDSSEAGAGTTQAGATLLSMRTVHWVKTGASNSGVVLPPGVSTTATPLGPGDSMLIVNATGNTLKVYPPGTGAFNAGSASAAISLTINQVMLATCLDGGTNANFATLVV